MTTPGNPLPSKNDPTAPHPGYDEEQPRTPRESQQPPMVREPHPDEGGMERSPTADPDPAEDA